MSMDIEVIIVNTVNEFIPNSFIRLIAYAKEVDEQYRVISHMEYGEKNGLLDSMRSFDSRGFITSETTFTCLQNFGRRRCHFSSGYTFDISFAKNYETDEYFLAFI
jgi:hypothetical protein